MAGIEINGCELCEVLQGRANADRPVLAMDDGGFAVLVGRYQPTGPGYALVVPRRHVQDLHALAAQDCGPMLQLVQRTSAAVRRVFGASGTTVMQHNGPPGQSVPHLHFHVVPRRVGDGYPSRAASPEPTDVLAKQARELAAALEAGE